MKKKFTILFLVLAIMLMATPVMAQREVTMMVDGKKVESDVAPYIEKGRTMVPARFITEALGGTAGYYTDSYPIPTIAITHPNQPLALSMFEGKNIALISQGAYRTDTAPKIINGRTMIPVRFITDYLGYDIKWDEETWTVSIDTKNKLKPEDFMEKYFDQKATNALENLLTNGDFSKEAFENALR